MKLPTVLLALLLCVGPMGSQEIRVGVLAHDVAPLWGNARIEQGADINAEGIFGKGIIRHSIGISINHLGATSRIYSSLIIGTQGAGLFGDLGLGVAYQAWTKRNLGSHVLFRIAAEVGYRWGQHSISILLDHISNANLAPHNAGLDVLGIRYGYRFGADSE